MSDWSYYETTYSQDERIADALQKERVDEQHQKKQHDQQRWNEFKNYYKKNKDTEDSVFRLSGFNFLKFTSIKVKFTFRPRDVVRRVSQKVLFYCTLRYLKSHWQLTRNTFPANYKTRICCLFYGKAGFTIDDSNLTSIILKIHDILIEWSKGEDKFRRKKYKDYKDGMDVYLDSDDEEIFLNEKEKKQLHRQREKILRRMIAPPTEQVRLIY